MNGEAYRKGYRQNCSGVESESAGVDVKMPERSALLDYADQQGIGKFESEGKQI